MSADTRVETVLTAAVAIADRHERGAYVDQACAGDEALRREVYSLLAAHDEAGTFLQQSAAGAPLVGPPPGDTTRVLPSDGAPPDSPEGAASTHLAETEGDRIGRYKLLEKIGTGGFGDVWMAEQEEPVRRRVALKIIKLGMDTRDVVARFEAERQALAVMDHPNIAKVHDGGATETGRPYFVMELVRGVRITDYCDAHKLPTVERLNLFIQVCQAVQHAHQKGIIHRDLKPSNILVTINDGMPVPKVIDFGIAKATEQRLTDKTVFTRFMQFLGTPAYMSPEQSELTSLDIDTRSDIYSLGVLLYELLTGKTPFDAKELLAAGLDEMRRTIREKEPVRPSTRLSTLQAADQTEVAKRRHTDPPKLINLLRGDLDWIVMKALEKDRTRRYETANAFALDIRRHLADESVSARAPSASYRFGKFARRNKAALGGAAAIAAILVIATAVSIWQAIRATRAEALVQKRVIEVAAERDQKDKARQAAETARQEAEAISTFLTEVFRSPDPQRDGRRTVTVAETLDRATRKLDTDLASQPARRAKLQATLGGTYQALGLNREAIPLFEKARDYYLATLGREHRATLNAMTSLAISYHDADRWDEALKLREEVLEIRRKVLGPENPDTLLAMYHLANSYHKASRQDEALKLRVQGLELRRKVSGAENRYTIAAMQSLANSYAVTNRQDEALKLREEALSLNRRVIGPEHPDTLLAMYNLATSYKISGRLEEELKLLEEAVLLCRKVLGLDHYTTLNAMNNLANSFHKAGRRDEALKLREEVLPLYRNVNGLEHRDTLGAMQNLANSYQGAQRYSEAEPLFREILQIRTRRHPPTNDTVVSASSSLANLLQDWAWAERGAADKSKAAERAREATRRLRDCLDASAKTLTPENPNLAETKSRLGGALVASAVTDSTLTAEARLAQLTEAESLLLEGQETLRQTETADRAYKRNALERLVWLYEAWDKPQQLEEWRTKLAEFDKARLGQ